MTIATVIGNGTSRLDLDLNWFQSFSTTYGCNAIYRDYTPDYLIAMDIFMVCEIIDNKAHYKTNFYTQHTNKIDGFQKEGHPINFFENKSKTTDSGTNAIQLATNHNHHTIILIGFDYVTNNLWSNIYHGTMNYTNPQAAPHHQAHSYQQRFMNIVRKNPNTKYIRVTNNHMNNNLDNYTEITTQHIKDYVNELHLQTV